MNKNNVLIPVDGAAFSLQILPCIRRFLNPSENHLILLRVEPEPEAIHIHQAGFGDIDIYVDETEASLRSNFADELLPTVRALKELGFTVTTKVEFGEPISELEAYIAGQAVDLVAMTTHGRMGLNRILHGSIAEHLLHHVDVPILLLHPLSQQRNRKRVKAQVAPLG
ncbi:MAG: universal stress protein [Caldilineaceae bacterium]